MAVDSNALKQLQQLQAQMSNAQMLQSQLAQGQQNIAGTAQWGGLLSGAQGITNAPAFAPPPMPAYTHEYVLYLQNHIIELQGRFLALHEKYEELLKFREWTQPGDENFKSQVPGMAKAATP